MGFGSMCCSHHDRGEKSSGFEGQQAPDVQESGLAPVRPDELETGKRHEVPLGRHGDGDGERGISSKVDPHGALGVENEFLPDRGRTIPVPSGRQDLLRGCGDEIHLPEYPGKILLPCLLAFQRGLVAQQLAHRARPDHCPNRATHADFAEKLLIIGPRVSDGNGLLVRIRLCPLGSELVIQLHHLESLGLDRVIDGLVDRRIRAVDIKGSSAKSVGGFGFRKVA
jgi:hypothetical protein